PTQGEAPLERARPGHVGPREAAGVSADVPALRGAVKRIAGRKATASESAILETKPDVGDSDILTSRAFHDAGLFLQPLVGGGPLEQELVRGRSVPADHRVLQRIELMFGARFGCALD